MHQLFLGIGGNIGDKELNFKKVKNLIRNRIGKILMVSSIYETPPWGFESEYSFWNQVLKVETNYSPQEVLKSINQIEAVFGRKRISEEYSSRQMDIDILFFDDLILETSDLKIPHPLLDKRKFVLIPLSEIAPDLVHPVFNYKVSELIEYCTDNSTIIKIS